jgi:hypothetical protein
VYGVYITGRYTPWETLNGDSAEIAEEGAIQGEAAMVGAILKELCRQKGIGILEAHAMSDHILMVSVGVVEIQHSEGRGVSDREECYTHISGIESKQRIYKQELLEQRLFRKHGGT